MIIIEQNTVAIEKNFNVSNMIINYFEPFQSFNFIRLDIDKA